MMVQCASRRARSPRACRTSLACADDVQPIAKLAAVDARLSEFPPSDLLCFATYFSALFHWSSIAWIIALLKFDGIGSS